MIAPIKQFKKKCIFAYQRFSYQMLLPLLSRLPLFLSESITILRGIFNAGFDLEWRSIALGEKFVKINTFKTLSQILPDSSPSTLRFKTYQRFISFAREELDAAMFAHKNLKPFFQKSVINGFDKWQKVLSSGTGLVVLCYHYDCFTMGIVLLAMKGIKVNVMSSNVAEDKRVSAYVQNFYEQKYRGMETHLNGGKIVHVENNLRFFYQALANNEVVIILSDLGASSKDNNLNIIAPFMNKKYYMAPGPFRLALKTGSQMAAFYCLNQTAGRYHIECSDVYHPADLNNTVNHLYNFLQQPVRRYPERWLASDVVRGYPIDE